MNNKRIAIALLSVIAISCVLFGLVACESQTISFQTNCDLVVNPLTVSDGGGGSIYLP